MSDLPVGETLPKWTMKQVPGPILAPCRPRLAGDSEDFSDWDEPHTLWIEDTSHWFYVFGQHCVENEDEKLVKAVRLHYEIFVDASGEMHVVDSDKYWGHDRRPASDKPARNVFVEVGYARIDCVVEPYPIWVLASPFQLSWARLPPMVAKTRTCRWSAFEKWSDERDLHHTVIPSARLADGNIDIPVASPWVDAFALNRALNKWLTAFEARMNSHAIKERFLYGAIKTLPSYAMNVHPAPFSDFFGECLRDELVYQQQLSEAAIRLLGLVEGKQFVAMLSDMVESKDASAWSKLVVIWARSYHRLPEVREGLNHVLGKTEKQGKVLESKFDALLALKNSRKVEKAYWNCVKMFVKAADHKGWLPEWAIKACETFALQRYGVLLERAKAGAKRVFTIASVKLLQKKATEHLGKTGFVLIVEVANIAYGVWDLYIHRDDSNNLKRQVTVIGATASVIAAFADGAGSTTWGERLLEKGGTPVRVGKSVLGMVSSVADIAVGWISADEAKSTGDKNAAFFHGATAVGGAIGIVGYALMASVAAAPIGAALVFLGGAIGAGGGIGAAIIHDTDLDEWMKFCKWGRMAGLPDAGRSQGKDIERLWSEGPLNTLHYDLDRQIRTLNTLIHRLKVDLKFRQSPDGHRMGIDVSASMQIVGDQTTMWLEVTMNGRAVRPWSPWKSGADVSGVQASFCEHFSGPDCREAAIRLRVDMLGDQQYWFPAKDVIATAKSDLFGPEVFAPAYVAPT
jgi:hypothetical protein